MKAIVLLFVVLLLSFRGFSQTPKELGSLDMRIGMFIEKVDGHFMEKRQSELAQILLKIDSTDKIGQVHVLGVDTDTLYRILKRMQPADLNNWTCLEAKGKTMVIPYFYISDNPEHNYVYKLYIGLAAQRPRELIISKSGQSVIIKYIVTFAPGRPMIQRTIDIKEDQ